ncbi:MAG: hypothetical protein HZA93_04670 [Verrucomicrobia bacterium]|nr:hypothetical protein [Verrucomicrobiota bacterium]
MNARTIRLLLLSLGLAAAMAADEKDTKITSRDMLRARILEENAKKQAASGTTTPVTSTEEKNAAPAANQAPADAKKSTDTAAKKSPKAAAKEAATAAKQEPATILPKVEVNRSRINEIDGRIIEQEREIAHEKVNTKPTEVDKALNHPKVAKALSIFGGESSSQRATVASERVKIMEEERDLLETMKAAKTKEERAELQKELEALRSYRRELEKSLR